MAPRKTPVSKAAVSKPRAPSNDPTVDCIKDGFIDLLFWQGARFEFVDELPEVLAEPTENVAVVTLQTEQFLLEAIGRFMRWDGVRAVLGQPADHPHSAGAAVERRGRPDDRTSDR